MSTGLDNLINQYSYTSKRRAFVFSQIAANERAGQVAGLGEHLQGALSHEKAVRELEARWNVTKRGGTPEGGNPRETDAQLDRALGTIYRFVADLAVSMPEDSAEGTVARRILTDVFPDGVVACTALPWAEEVVEARRLSAALKDILSAHTETLPFSLLLERVDTLADQLESQIGAGPESVTFKEVRTAQETGHQNLLGTIARILGAFPGTTREHVSARAKLLAPLVQQNARIRAGLRTRRALPDVDPTTGADVPGTEALTVANTLGTDSAE